MSFPAPNSPEILHLWIDSPITLIANYSSFFNKTDFSCINTFTMYQIPTITNSTNSTNLGNFICEAKTNHGICSVAGVVNPWDYTELPRGTQYVQDIINYNNRPATLADPCRKIDYITLESEFWNIEAQNINPQINNNCCIQINAGATFGTVTGSGCLNGLQAGMLIRIPVGTDIYYRQVIGFSGSRIDFDRAWDHATTQCLPFTYINNLTYYALDYETFLYRLIYNIRPMAIANNLQPVELYVSRRLTNEQYERLIPHVDRVLIELEYDSPIGTSATYPLYTDPNYATVRNVLSACSVTRQGTISINANTNQLTGSGTLFTRDLGERSKIIINGSTILEVNTVISDTSATIVGLATSTIAGGTYATYFDYAPMFFIATGAFAYPNRRAWMTNGNLKSYKDVYRFHALSSFSVGTDVQIGTPGLPISFNNETYGNIQDSANLVGLSIFHRTGFESLSPISGGTPCIPCSGLTVEGCEVSATTTSNCLEVVIQNPACEVCNGSISGFTNYGYPPFTYILSGSTFSPPYSSTTGYFTGLCAGSYSLCVVDFSGFTECYYQTIVLYYTFFADINTYINGFCITISGGTPPYHVFLDETELYWNDNNGAELTTNCYTADCNTISVITVGDSSF